MVLRGHLPPQEYTNQLAKSDIGVAPYCGWGEYSGLKLFDYKAAGLAIIASGENGQPAVIEHGQNGWIVPPCDEVALSNSIVHLARNYQVRRQLGIQARLEAERCKSWRQTAENLEIVFNQVLTN